MNIKKKLKFFFGYFHCMNWGHKISDDEIDRLYENYYIKPVINTIETECIRCGSKPIFATIENEDYYLTHETLDPQEMLD